MRSSRVDCYPRSSAYCKSYTTLIPYGFQILLTGCGWIERPLLEICLSWRERDLLRSHGEKIFERELWRLLKKDVDSSSQSYSLWNEVQRKVRQKMGESSWHELMQNLGGFLNVTDQLTNQMTGMSEDLISNRRPHLPRNRAVITRTNFVQNI